MATGDLTNVANVQAQAGMATAASGVLASLITAASADIVREASRPFGATVSITRRLNGNGQVQMYLPENPIVSVSSLAIDGKTISQQVADQQPGWFIADESLCLFGYCFTRGKRNVNVSWTYGYTVVPKDIEQACIELVVANYRRVPRGPELQSETIPASGAVVSYALKDMPAAVQRVVDNYRRLV